MPEPIALLRFGRFDTPLSQGAIEFDEPLIHLRYQGFEGFSFFKQGEKPYLFLVTQNLNKALQPYNHNIILEIDSYSERYNNEIADKFERAIGVRLNMFVPRPSFEDAVKRTKNFEHILKNPEAYFKWTDRYQTQ